MVQQIFKKNKKIHTQSNHSYKSRLNIYAAFLLENECFCDIIVLIYERNDYNMADKILMRNWEN